MVRRGAAIIHERDAINTIVRYYSDICYYLFFPDIARIACNKNYTVYCPKYSGAVHSVGAGKRDLWCVSFRASSILS